MLIVNSKKQAVEIFITNHIIREFKVTITQIDPPTKMKINRAEKTRVMRFHRCFEERSKCKKKWRCTKICKIAARNKPDSAVDLEIPLKDASPKETIVNSTARANPTRYFFELRWPIPKASFIPF
jgi:hypothetical protein